MQNISKSSLAICFILGILATFFFVENSKTQKQLKLMCQALSGEYAKGECLSLAKPTAAPSPSKIERCPEGQFVIAVHPDRTIECGLLARNSATAIRLDQTPTSSPLPEIGGWRVLDICPMDKSAPQGVCREMQQGSISECTHDVLPTHLAMNALRVSIPVPCQERSARCYVADDIHKPQTLRTVLQCDTYKVLKFSVSH